MKRLTYLIILAVMLVASCTPELPPLPKDELMEVTFTSSTDLGFKGDPFNCDNPEPDYAEIIIQAGTPDQPVGDPFTKTAPVFYVDGVMFTQAIKLEPGEYTVLNFLLYADAEEDGDEDLLVNAVPESDSEFGALVANPLPVTFLVSAFVKTEVQVGVLCFEPSTYLQFGFAWFRVDETIGRQRWFFGDFCTKFYKDYAGSLYGDDPKVDMPAIFSLALYFDDNRNGQFEPDELVSHTSNETDYMTTGAPMAVHYLDPEGAGDLFELKVSIYVKTGDDAHGNPQFEYRYFGSWFFMDDQFDMYTNADLTEGQFDAGTDGVYDFVLGNCTVDAADFAFAPYMNLPDQVSMYVGNTFAPGDEGGAYLDIFLSGFNSGFDITPDTWYGSYCFDREIDISGGQTYEVNVYSSLNRFRLPEIIRNENWDQVNWLVNHLEDFPGYTWADLQQALWELEDSGYQYVPGNGTGVAADPDMVNDMVAEALAHGAGYVPMPGGWAAVTFIKTEDIINQVVHPTIQTVFIIVDP